MRKKLAGCVAGTAALILTAFATPSMASDEPEFAVPNGAADFPWDEATNVTYDADGGITFTGEFPTQSTDPSRWDYVPVDASNDEAAARSAVGTQVISSFSYSWNGLQLPVPAGHLAHRIDGSGLSLSGENAIYGPAIGIGIPWGVNLCNWRIDFQNRPAAGGVASTSTGPIHSTCSTFGIERTRGPFKAKAGVQCARLFVNSTFRGEQCHSVHA